MFILVFGSMPRRRAVLCDYEHVILSTVGGFIFILNCWLLTIVSMAIVGMG